MTQYPSIPEKANNNNDNHIYGSSLNHLCKGGGDNSASNDTASVVVDLDADNSVSSGIDSLQGSVEGDQVVAGSLGAASGDGRAGITGGQSVFELVVVANGEESLGGQAVDRSIDVDANQQGHGLANGNTAGQTTALGDGEAHGSRQGSGGALGGGAELVRDGGGHGSSHAGSDEEELEHLGGVVESAITSNVVYLVKSPAIYSVPGPPVIERTADKILRAE